MSNSETAKQLFAAGLSAHVSEIRLFWRESSLCCRWIVPDGDFVYVEKNIVESLKCFYDSDESASHEQWREIVSNLLGLEDPTCEPLALNTLTWLMRVLESPHRSDINAERPGNFLWSLFTEEIPEEMLTHILKANTKALKFIDIDTASLQYENSKRPILESYAEKEEDIERMFYERFERLRRFRNVIYYGIPNIGKAYISKELIGRWKSMTGREVGAHCLTVMNYALDYDELVERYAPGAFTSKFVIPVTAPTPKILADPSHGENYFIDPSGCENINEGLFVSFCRLAAFNPDKDYIYMIDCISSGNLETDYGDVFYLFDRNARVPWSRSGEQGWNLKASGARFVHLRRSGRTFFIPENVYIIGTSVDTDLFSSQTLLQQFAVEKMRILNSEQLIKALIGGFSIPLRERVESYALKSVKFLEEINKILYGIGGHAATLGYGPLFGMCRDIAKSLDVDDANRIALSHWRHRMLPPILGKLAEMSKNKESRVRTHIFRLIDLMNQSWLRVEIKLEGSENFESLNVDYMEI